MIEISLNNSLTQIAAGTYLSAALEQWEMGEKVAVAINGEFVPRSTYAQRVIEPGDKIDVVKPVGGG